MGRPITATVEETRRKDLLEDIRLGLVGARSAGAVGPVDRRAGAWLR